MRRTGIAATAATLLIAGCGGEERQDADEPEGTFPVAVEEVRFPTSQRLAQPATFTMRVRNAGEQAVPNLAVTLRGFASRHDESQGGASAGEGQQAADALSDPSRPVWILDGEPAGGVTAYDDTWTAGRLAPGATATLRWRVTPIRAGAHTLRYRIAGGLNGRAEAVGVGGRPIQGELRIEVGDEPPQARVDPATGAVVRPE